MNRTLTIETFAGRMALMTGMDNEACVEFVKRAFGLIAESLSESEPVKIKGFGTFVASDRGVEFIADEAVAQRVNEPFAYFEPVEVDPEVASDLLSEEEPEPQQHDDSPVEETTAAVEVETVLVSAETTTAAEAEVEAVETPAQTEAKPEAETETQAEKIPDIEPKESLNISISEECQPSATDETDEESEPEATTTTIASAVELETAEEPKADINPISEPQTGAEEPPVEDTIREVKQEISIRGYGLEISPEMNIEQRTTDRRMRIVMFLLGLALGIAIGAAMVYFLPELLQR